VSELCEDFGLSFCQCGHGVCKGDRGSTEYCRWAAPVRQDPPLFEAERSPNEVRDCGHILSEKTSLERESVSERFRKKPIRSNGGSNSMDKKKITILINQRPFHF